MDMDECVNSLRNRVWQVHPCNANRIVAYIISRKTPAEIKQCLLVSNDQIRALIMEAMSFFAPPAQQFSVLPPPQPLSGGHGLPFPNLQPQVHPSGSSHGFQAPLPIDQIGPLHHGLLRFPPVPLVGPNGTFQSPFSEFIGMVEHFQSLNVAGDGMPSNDRNACRSVTGYPPSSSKTRTKPCDFHFYRGYCKKGEDCKFSHVSEFREMHNVRRVHTLESLLILDKEIRELLFSLQPPKVPIESVANMYIERYGKPLQVEGFSMEGHQHGSVGCSLICLLLGLKTTSVIKRQGQHYIVPMEDAPKYLADDFKLVKYPASNCSNQIYLTFMPKSTCTKRDAWNYFSRYGTVNNVRIMHGERYMFGFVSFLYSETVKRILAEKSPRTPHVISGNQVFVKAYKEKHELKKFAQEDVHSNSGAHKVSDVIVIHEHRTEENLSAKHQSSWEELYSARGLGIDMAKCSIKIAPEMASPPTHKLSLHSPSQDDNMAESPHLSSANRLDEASADQDRDDVRLPESLDDIY